MSVKYRDNNGNESPLAGLNGLSGELVPSVSYYQSGQKTSDTTSWSTGETGTFTIDLSENMPDTNYIVVPTLNVVGVSAIVHSKTVNSFKVTVRNDREETIAQAITLYWQAFKLMTNEQHALDEQAIAQNTSDISDLQAVVPSGASASNQLVTDRDITLLNNRNRKITFNNTHSSAQISGYWYKLTFQLSSVKNDAYGADYQANQHWNVFDCTTGGANIKDGRFRLRLGTNISGVLESGNCYLINDSATDLSSVVEVYTDTTNNCIYLHAVNNWTCWLTLTLLSQPFNDSWLVEKVDDTLYTLGNAPSSIDLTELTQAEWQNSPMVTARDRKFYIDWKSYNTSNSLTISELWDVLVNTQKVGIKLSPAPADATWLPLGTGGGYWFIERIMGANYVTNTTTYIKIYCCNWTNPQQQYIGHLVGGTDGSTPTITWTKLLTDSDLTTGTAAATNTNTFTFDLPTMSSGDAWEITVSAQQWNSNLGFVTKYIASRSGTSYKISNCGGATTGFSATISDNTIKFVWDNSDNTIAYWRARYTKML